MISVLDTARLRTADVRRRFDRAAPGFDGVDFVHAVTREGLLERLDPLLVAAGTVVDLGCATGAACRHLARRFRPFRVIGLDLSFAMLRQTQKKRSLWEKTSAVQADATALPFPDQSVAVIFANLLLPWIDDPAELFAEVARVLQKNGLFLFSTLGPDSLSELRSAWKSVDADVHVQQFFDMHDIGDTAVRAGLRDPVLDVDRLAITYASADAAFADLTAIGGRNCLLDRRRSLTGRARFGELLGALEATRRDGALRFDLELIYGHCWGAGRTAKSGEYRVDAAQIRRRS